jgi:LysM repeat protein
MITLTTTSSTTTTSSATVTGPTPQQTGIIANCNKYHLVESGDGCASIATAYGISLPNFYAWNPAVGSSCGSLWLGYYVCVGTSCE